MHAHHYHFDSTCMSCNYCLLTHVHHHQEACVHISDYNMYTNCMVMVVSEIALGGGYKFGGVTHVLF